MEDEISIIVDEKDNILEYKKRSELAPGDIFRTASCILIDENNRVLLCKRSTTKKYSPGLWSSSAAGGVCKGETYLDAITKEVQEELGLSNISFKFIETRLVHGIINSMMVGRFIGKINSNTEIPYNTDDFDEIRWFSLDELKNIDETLKGQKYNTHLIQEIIDILET